MMITHNKKNLKHHCYKALYDYTVGNMHPFIKYIKEKQKTNTPLITAIHQNRQVVVKSDH